MISTACAGAMDIRVVRMPGYREYDGVYRAMQSFTAARQADTRDELWCLQHLPVFTQGIAGKAEHVLAPGDIPVVQTDRGGQVTYHGPGQLVVYFLFDVRRLRWGPRNLVCLIEGTIIELLEGYGIRTETREKAPGVYVEGAKICSLGLRIRRGYCYHGLALNVDMDVEPFRRINPCGLVRLPITQVKDFVTDIRLPAVEGRLVELLLGRLGMTGCTDFSRNLGQPA